MPIALYARVILAVICQITVARWIVAPWVPQKARDMVGANQERGHCYVGSTLTHRVCVTALEHPPRHYTVSRGWLHQGIRRVFVVGQNLYSQAMP